MKASAVIPSAMLGIIIGIGIHRICFSEQTSGPQLIDEEKSKQERSSEVTLIAPGQIDGEEISQSLLTGEITLDLKIAFSKWVELEPVEALAYVESLDSTNAQYFELFTLLFKAWAHTDSSGAIETAMALEANGDLALDTISEALRKSDPLKSVIIDFRDQASEEQLTELWNLASLGDEESIAEYLRSAQTADLSVRERADLLARVAEAKYLKDPDAAFHWAKSLALPEARRNSIDLILEKVAKQDPESAIRYLESLPNWRSQTDSVLSIARSWHQTDSRAAIQWVGRTLHGRERSLALQDLLYDTLASDPASAADLAVELTLASDTSVANFSRITGRYAEHDPEAALTWLQNLPESIRINRASAAAEVASAWAINDAESARAMLSQISDPILARGFASGIGESFGESSPKEALQWASRLSEDGYPEAMKGVLAGYAKTDPVGASLRVSEITDDRARMQAASAVAENWARSDPMAAAHWAAAIEEPETQAAAIGQVVRAWARVDPNSTAEWVSEFPEGLSKDQSAAEIAHSVVIADPEAAFEWAVSISDQAIRWRTLPSIVASWGVRDPNAALNAVSSIPQPESVDTLTDLIHRVAP